MIELALLIPTAILGFLLWQEKRDRKDAEDAWRLERVALLDRIQAPERAVINEFEPNGLRHVPFDDDEAYWEVTHGDS